MENGAFLGRIRDRFFGRNCVANARIWARQRALGRVAHGARGCDFCAILPRPRFATTRFLRITLRQVLGCNNREWHRVGRRVLHVMGIFSRFYERSLGSVCIIPHVGLEEVGAKGGGAMCDKRTWETKPTPTCFWAITFACGLRWTRS